MIYPEHIEALEKEWAERDPLKKYKNDPDPEKRRRANAWGTAIGLQMVDGLRVSDFLLSVAVLQIEGEITMEEAIRLVEEYHKK